MNLIYIKIKCIFLGLIELKRMTVNLKNIKSINVFTDISKILKKMYVYWYIKNIHDDVCYKDLERFKIRLSAFYLFYLNSQFYSLDNNLKFSHKTCHLFILLVKAIISKISTILYLSTLASSNFGARGCRPLAPHSRAMLWMNIKRPVYKRMYWFYNDSFVCLLSLCTQFRV